MLSGTAQTTRLAMHRRSMVLTTTTAAALFA